MKKFAISFFFLMRFGFAYAHPITVVGPFVNEQTCKSAVRYALEANSGARLLIPCWNGDSPWIFPLGD